MQLKSHRTVEQIARKHRMDVSDIQRQLDMGIPIEHEHSRNKILATDIALQHLDEIPDYYTRLKKMEASAKKEHKKFKDVKEDAVTDLQRGITELPDASYDSIDNLMRRIMKKRKMSAKQLHNDFVDKHNQTPDTWAKKNMKEEKGLWDNIHARREKGLPRKKPGQKGYPKTLDIEEGLKQARKNVGASKCWPGKVAKGTKIKNGEEVPDCRPIKEESGVRYCPKCAKDETRDECKYGQKYWDMFSMPIMLKDYTPNTPHPGNMPEEKDHEYSMARSELSTIVTATKRLRKKIGKGEGNLKAWVQSKITKAADYIDTAADYIDSGEMKKESISIEDANGNHYAEFIDIIKTQPLKASKGIGSRLVGEGISFDVGGKKLSSAQEKLHLMSPSQRSQLPSQMVKKLVGADLPPIKSSPSSMVKTADSYEPEKKQFTRFMIEAKKSEMKCNSPKSQPVGDSLTGKSHVVKACANGEEKLIRFGQRGVKGSPKKKGESKEYASRRNRFQTRHAKNIAKGKMSAAYWANKVKW